MRGLLLGVCWGLVGTGLVASAAARAAEPSPQEVAAQFAAAVNASDAAAAPCRFLTADLRDLLVEPTYAGLWPWLPESYTEESRVRACDVFVDLLNGYVDSGGIPRWVRTEPGPATVVEQTDTLAHLRVPVRRVSELEGETQTESATAEVLLRLEPGGWKLVWPSLLWEFDLDVLDAPPAGMADAGALLDALARTVAPRREHQQALVDGYLRERTRVETRPLRWSGERSSALDRLRDVRIHQRQVLEDQSQAPGDLRAAALRTDGETLTYELRFRDRVPDRFAVSFDVRQRGRVPDGEEWWSTRSADWSVAMDDGWVSGWRGSSDDPRPLRGVRASVDGDALRVAFPAREVRGDVRLDRLLRWSVSVSTRAPGTAMPPDGLVDDLPEEDAGARSEGVIHPAGARETTPVCVERQKGLRNSVPAFVHVGERVPVRVNNLWSKSDMADVTITARGVTRRVEAADVYHRTFHVRAPVRPGRFRVAVAWRQVDAGGEPPIPPCDGRDVFVVTAFASGARLGDDRLPRVDGDWRVEGPGGRSGSWTVTPACVAGACSIALRTATGRRLRYELGRRSLRRVISTRPGLTGTCTGRSDYGTGPVEQVRYAFRERMVELLTVEAVRTDASGNPHATRLLRRTVVARSPSWRAREGGCRGSVRELSRATAVRLPG